MASKKWKPHRTHEIGKIVQGPPTRRYTAPAKARWTLKILKRLRGSALATWATRAAALRGNRDLSFKYDKDSNLYISRQEDEHAFSHPRRVTTLFHGHFSRGMNLVYDYLLDQITFRDGDWIIDIGANTGDLALSFRAMGRKVNFVSFEPSPGEFAALSRNLEASSAVGEFQAHQIALWSEESEGLTFYLKPSNADSSILPIPGATDTITIPAKRLSDVLGDDDRRYRLMKLEAEGAEPEILAGAVEVLSRVDYIAADVGFERGKDAASTLPEVTNFLLAHGFEIVGLGYTRLVLLFRNKNAKD